MAKVTMVTTPDPEENDDSLELLEEDDVVLEDEEDIDAGSDETLNVEDVDPSTPIWEGGPSAGQVVEWKQTHGDVYCTSVTMDRHVVWRTLRRSEYKAIVKQIEQIVSSGQVSQIEAEMLNEELLCQVCSLFPKFGKGEFESELAGLPAILSQQILAASGFTSIDLRGL